jgi:hypothetical protein
MVDASANIALENTTERTALIKAGQYISIFTIAYTSEYHSCADDSMLPLLFLKGVANNLQQHWRLLNRYGSNFNSYIIITIFGN